MKNSRRAQKLPSNRAGDRNLFVSFGLVLCASARRGSVAHDRPACAWRGRLGRPCPLTLATENCALELISVDQYFGFPCSYALQYQYLGLVPSDPKLSLNPTPACTAQSFATGRLSMTSRLPAAPFGSDGLTPGRSHSSLPVGTCISQPPFLSTLERPPVSRLPLRFEYPGLLLRCLAELSASPFDLRLLHPRQLAPARARSTP
jgi:hypothetical protein